MKKAQAWHRALAAAGACRQAQRWARDYKTFPEAWRACRNPYWLLWVIAHTAEPPTRNVWDGTRMQYVKLTIYDLLMTIRWQTMRRLTQPQQCRLIRACFEKDGPTWMT